MFLGTTNYEVSRRLQFPRVLTTVIVWFGEPEKNFDLRFPFFRLNVDCDFRSFTLVIPEEIPTFFCDSPKDPETVLDI